MTISKKTWKALANSSLGFGIANLLFISSIRLFGEHNIFMTKVSIVAGLIFIIFSGAIYFFAIRTAK